jgi:hypothetical protein
MTLEEEKQEVIKELENILTIDGRGRPRKGEGSLVAYGPSWQGNLEQALKEIFEQALKEINGRKW